MFLVQLNQPDELPSVREVTQPHFLRLAVVEAYRAGHPIPVSVDEGAAYLRQHCPTLWGFYSLEDADLWASAYDGEQAEGVRYLVRDYVATRYTTTAHDFDPALYEVRHVQYN